MAATALSVRPVVSKSVGQAGHVIAVALPDLQPLGKSAKERRIFFAVKSRWSVFAAIGFHDISAERVRDPLHSVADAEHGNAEGQNFAIARGASASYTELGPPESTMPLGWRRLISSKRSIARQNRGEDLLLANAPRDQLRVLTAEIQDDNPAARAQSNGPRFSTRLSSMAAAVPELPRNLPFERSLVRGISRAKRLLHDDIHQLLRHDNRLYDFLAHEQLCDARIVHGAFDQFLFADAIIHQHLAAHAPVDLDHDLKLLFFGQIFAELWPFDSRKAARMPEHFPELLADVRSHGRKHQHQEFEHIFRNSGIRAVIERLLRLQFIHQLHDQRHGGIEMPARFEILGHAPQRLMRLAEQRFFFRRGARKIERTRLCWRSTPRNRSAWRSTSRNTLVKKRAQPSIPCFAPLQIFFRRRGEQRVHARRVAAVSSRPCRSAPTTLPLDFDIFAAVFEHHALREEPHAPAREFPPVPRSRMTLQKNRE